jgi:DNA-binding response OmpR family regulator
MPNPLRILLVEDDPDDVDLLESALRENNIGFQSTVIAQGDQVLKHLELCKIFPDIIILDLNLPKMHGKEILTQIKSSDIIKQIPVVILTTSSAPADRSFCLHAGASAFLIKPVTLAEFNAAVQTIISLVPTYSAQE